ncbi:hypothetical protein CNR22_02720 [Sphingobacteriaceae bacterium]|nr:hypothetical protein CNR22_02720 [Sphingobacteriaceae bacterium]
MHGQVKTFGLSKANSQLFGSNLYVYGIKQNGSFCIYKLDFKPEILDSITVETSKGAADNYLQCWSDTLHGFLNIYLQKKEKKDLSIYRLTKRFELIAKIENTEIARLNNTSLFSAETFYFNNSVYSIKAETDTSGKQFYLNKYSLKSTTENFDYTFKWQFPFERKNIHSAHIFYATKMYVYLYVNVFGGLKTGQWLLKLEAETAKLIKATKINDKGDSGSYLFGEFLVDKTSNSIQFIGQKLKDAEINYKENKFNPASNFLILYSFQIDSLGDISGRQEFKVPVSDLKSSKPGSKKDLSYYMLKILKPLKNEGGDILFTGDLYKTNKGNPCYLYSNTLTFCLKPAEENLFTLDKNTIQPNIQLEDYYFTSDKLDMNGRLCTDSTAAIEKLFYGRPGFPIKQDFKLDTEKNPMWILSKHLLKNNNVNYSFLSPVKKIYQITKIEDLSEANTPVLIILSQNSFLISSQPEEGKYQLKLYNW